MNIAILHCHRSPRICTGASCFKAFNLRTKSFARYEHADVQLCAFFDCGGCDCDLANHPGMQEKIGRLHKENVVCIHAGACVGGKCPRRQELLDFIRNAGFELVEGTH